MGHRPGPSLTLRLNSDIVPTAIPNSQPNPKFDSQGRRSARKNPPPCTQYDDSKPAQISNANPNINGIVNHTSPSHYQQPRPLPAKLHCSNLHSSKGPFDSSRAAYSHPVAASMSPAVKHRRRLRSETSETPSDTLSRLGGGGVITWEVYSQPVGENTTQCPNFAVW